jgi:hypothetical protein
MLKDTTTDFRSTTAEQGIHTVFMPEPYSGLQNVRELLCVVGGEESLEGPPAHGWQVLTGATNQNDAAGFKTHVPAAMGLVQPREGSTKSRILILRTKVREVSVHLSVHCNSRARRFTLAGPAIVQQNAKPQGPSGIRYLLSWKKRLVVPSPAHHGIYRRLRA